MADQDLIAYARDAASRGDDLFALLGTDATASESEIRRAFRRKALTAHPDKAGDAYDPALYERIERARDVLTTPEAREAYDAGMRAVLQKKMQMNQMSDKCRRMAEDLERREAEARAAKRPKQPDPAQEARRRDMAARGWAKMEEWRRLREEAEVREQLAKEREAGAAASGPSATSAGKPDTAGTPQDGQPALQTLEDYDKRIEELEQRLKESKQRKAEKQQRKEQRKAGKKSKWDTKAGTPSGSGSPPSEKENSDHPPPPPAAEPQADEDKVSGPAEAAPPAPHPGAGDPPNPSDRWASVLARLRAAQAKKDEDKRRKAEEASAAGAAP
jgi:DnaJ family protein C protein 17